MDMRDERAEQRAQAAAQVIEQAREMPQLTVRAVVTGLVLGVLLAPSNIYAGLKIGWAFNMAITAALLSYGFWGAAARATGTRPMNILENNINQVVASAGAMIASSGLVAAVPALTLLTGYRWSWPRLALWTMTVSMIGVAAALLTRHRLLVVERLRFPSGLATATTLQEMYARGQGAAERLRALLYTGAVSGALRLAVMKLGAETLTLPGRLSLGASTRLTVSATNLGFGLDPSLMMLAVGVLIGPRSGWSLLIGALLSWGVFAPLVLMQGWVAPGPSHASWFGGLVEWMLWPGVALMVAAALTSLFASWRSMLPARWRGEQPAQDEPIGEHDTEVTPRLTYVFVAAAALLGIVLQVSWFDVALHTALLGMGFTFLLATVAARVTGETDITPIGAMGQVTQLVFSLLAPGNVTANLMAGNVTGGAASQCADLMQDLRSGEILRASLPRLAVAQLIGVVVGGLAGSAAYLLLVPDPAQMLLTETWPAPAVATWKAAAEVLAKGLGALPPGTLPAMAIASCVGVVLSLLERRLDARALRWVPSPSSLGLAMVIPASYAISMWLGAMLAVLATRLRPGWSEKFLLVIAAGAIAGESLTGVGFAMLDTARTLLAR